MALTQEDLIKQWETEENYAFQGWDFLHINGRWLEPNTPWDYKAIIHTYLKETDILLDMGTGGGEFLLTLNHPYENTYATEAYRPNYELCVKTLSPLGITVLKTYTDENLNADDKLPFYDNMFDVIINRHESFDLKEVNRTLKHGGYFITQQVGNQNSNKMMRKLNDNFEPYMPHHTISNYLDKLHSLDFEIIESNEFVYPVKILDVGTLVFMAKTIVWEFPGFSVKTHLSKLLDCQKEVEEKGCLEDFGHRFYIVSRKGVFIDDIV